MTRKPFKPLKKNAHGKIPLPWANEHKDLAKQKEMHTNVYWHMSKAWNDIPGPMYCVGDVIDDSNTILRNTDPNSRLARVVNIIKDDVITFGTKKQKQGGRRKKKQAPAEVARLFIL